MSRPPPYAAPSCQTRTAADCFPRRSPPAASPASSARMQAPHERLARGRAVGVEHRPHDVLAGEDVPLHRHLAVDDAARPGQALVAGVVGRAAGEIGHAELPPRRELVGRRPAPPRPRAPSGRRAGAPARPGRTRGSRAPASRSRPASAPPHGTAWPTARHFEATATPHDSRLAIEGGDREGHAPRDSTMFGGRTTRPVDAPMASVLYSGLLE